MAIIKNAKNINIQVANNYTSLSKISHEESEEVIIEATKQNLELSSQKRAILQGFGKAPEKSDEPEESKSLELKIEKTTFVPLSIPNFKEEKENDKIKFKVLIKEGSFDKLNFKIKNEGSEIYSEEITQSLQAGDTHEIEWDGFSRDRIYDSVLFKEGKLTAEITDGSTTSQTKISGKYEEAKWVDVKIDDRSKKVDVTLRINLKEEKIEKDVSKTFADLVLLAQEGVKEYWGRNTTRKVGTGVKINNTDYEVFIDPVNTETDSMPPLNVYASKADYGRSRNWLLSRKLFYNDGWYVSAVEDEKEFKHTAPHEIGHEILQAFGGKFNYSYIHKGSSTMMQKQKKDVLLPPSGEIDLMKYYYDDQGTAENRRINQFYERNVASEKDVLGLLWCSKLKIK